MTYRLRPTSRGNLQFGPVEMRVDSPLRLWQRAHSPRRTGRVAGVSELRGAVRIRAAGYRSPSGGRRHSAAAPARRGNGLRSTARVPGRRQPAQDRLEGEPAHEQADFARVSGRARSADPVPGGLRAAHAREGRRMLALRSRPGCHAAARLCRAAAGRRGGTDDHERRGAVPGAAQVERDGQPHPQHRLRPAAGAAARATTTRPR